MNPLFSRLIEARRLDEDFLHPQYNKLSSPWALPDMVAAVARLQAALEKHENIYIYGDYDVDGVTASALMEQALRLAGFAPAQLKIMLPDRFTDGYGMSSRLVECAQAFGAGLVVTVDCGSRNHEIVQKLAACGIDTIITDHHECAATLPAAVAVINPKRPNFTGPKPLADLAGAGVAFKLAQALVEKGIIPAGQEKWLLDLVLLGTICDNMTLSLENRILTYYGAKVLTKTRRPGLRELMRLAQVRAITAETIGYQLGPRLNAAGRLETAELALNLLRTTSLAEATALASQLDQLNSDRRTKQRAATSEIAKRGIGTAPVIVETGPWHEGILGIVAGRLVEMYHRPAFVLAETEPGILKGSGRSFGDFNLATALQAVGDTILGGGGHAGAAGVRLSASKLDDFRRQINLYYQGLDLTNQAVYLKTVADLTTANLADFSLDFLENLSLLEPFGPGNLEPVFQLDHTNILELKRLGTEGKHLRLDICDAHRKNLKLVAFSAPEPWFTLDTALPHTFLVRPYLNEWQGVRSVEARLLEVIS